MDPDPNYGNPPGYRSARKLEDVDPDPGGKNRRECAKKAENIKKLRNKHNFKFKPYFIKSWHCTHYSGKKQILYFQVYFV